MFQAVTSHWLKAGRYRREKNYRMGSALLMDYLQTFPHWWASTLGGRKRLEAIADAIPPLYVYYLFRNVFRYKPRRILDIYAGVGGWLLGIALYVDLDIYYEAVEVDRERCRALSSSIKMLKLHHYIDIEYNVVCMDARDYEPNEKFDTVVGSPPCEDVTPLRKLAKGRKVGTFELTRRYLEIVNAVKPWLAVYENVYDEKLAEMLRSQGFVAEMHDMSVVLPQSRRRLIAWRIIRG